MVCHSGTGLTPFAVGAPSHSSASGLYNGLVLHIGDETTSYWGHIAGKAVCLSGQCKAHLTLAWINAGIVEQWQGLRRRMAMNPIYRIPEDYFEDGVRPFQRFARWYRFAFTCPAGEIFVRKAEILLKASGCCPNARVSSPPRPWGNRFHLTLTPFQSNKNKVQIPVLAAGRLRERILLPPEHRR